MSNLRFRRPDFTSEAWKLAAKYSALSENIKNISSAMMGACRTLQLRQLSAADRDNVLTVMEHIQNLEVFSEHCKVHRRALLFGIVLDSEDNKSFRNEVNKHIRQFVPADDDPRSDLLQGAALLQALGKDAGSWFETPALIDLLVMADCEEMMRIAHDLRGT